MGEPLEVHIRKMQEFYWSDEDPDGRGFVALADALRKAGDLREAHRLLRDGLARHPDYLSGHVVAAWLSVDQGEPEEAEARFRRALELDPRNVAALRGLADVLLERGESEEALGVLDTLRGEDPLDLDLPGQIEDIKVLAQHADAEPSEASEPPPVWDDPVGIEEELDWDSAALQEDVSVDAVDEGEPVPSPEDLEEVLVTPTLGEIYLRQGLFDRAEEVFLALLEEDPGNEHLQHRLKEARNLLESPSETDVARGEVEEVVELDALAPDEVVAIDALAPDEVVAIDALAPDEVMAIDTLAPDEVVGIDALAPDKPVGIDALAPDPEPEAGDSEDAGGREAEDDPTIDAFERWLENLQ